MADTKVMLHCHGCDTWAPTTASDGQRKRCPNCGMNIQVIRYPELHPKSAIGLNVKPLASPVPGSSLAVRSAPASPAVRSGRPVIQGSVINSKDVTIRSMAEDVSREIAAYRQKKAVNARTQENPLRAHTPPINDWCNFCVNLGIKDASGQFTKATHEVTTMHYSEVMLACSYHVRELQTLHYLLRSKPIQHRPNPGPGYQERGIGDVPENPQLAGLREQEAREREERERKERERANKPSIRSIATTFLSNAARLPTNDDNRNIEDYYERKQ